VSISRSIGIAVATAAVAAGPGLGWAGDPPQRTADPPVNAQLLEFLGSVDAPADSTQPDDGNWLAYLAQINIGKVAKASQATPASARPKPAASPAATGKPNDSEVQDDD
jgi:hypothetical protein